MTFSPVQRAICAARLSGAAPCRLELNPAMIVMRLELTPGRGGDDVRHRHVVLGAGAVDDVEAMPDGVFGRQRRDDDLIRMERRRRHWPAPAAVDCHRTRRRPRGSRNAARPRCCRAAAGRPCGSPPAGPADRAWRRYPSRSGWPARPRSRWRTVGVDAAQLVEQLLRIRRSGWPSPAPGAALSVRAPLGLGPPVDEPLVGEVHQRSPRPTTAGSASVATGRRACRPICTRIATIATAVRIDSTGKSHIFTFSSESGVRQRSTICEMAISR